MPPRARKQAITVEAACPECAAFHVWVRADGHRSADTYPEHHPLRVTRKTGEQLYGWRTDCAKFGGPMYAEFYTPKENTDDGF